MELPGDDKSKSEAKNSDSGLIKEMARRELYATVFDVWVSSGRELKYSPQLWDYFCVVVAPLMMEHTPTEEEFFGILLMEQTKRMKPQRLRSHLSDP
jgi:hypothetical protein